MTMEREAGIVLWKEIARELAADIGRRAIAPGGQLPTEPVLAERFGVNRHTVRRAVASLERDGLVRVEHGRGTFVREAAVDYILSKRTRFSENLGRQDRSTKKRLLRAFAMEARGDVARALELRPGAPVTVVEVLAEADGHVLAHALQHFPARRFPGIAAVFEKERSITRTLAHFGVTDYTRKVTRISARLPEADVARALRQPRSRPVLQTVAVNVDAAGKPVEFGVTHFAGDLVQLVVEPE